MNQFQYDPTQAGGPFNQAIAQKEQSFVQQVFNWMFFGLLTTAAVSFFVSSNPTIMKVIIGNQLIFFGLMIGNLALVWNLSANADKMSAQAASTNFFIYSALNGLSLSPIFLVYTGSSIATTFLVAASMFGAMALYGATTKKDISSWGAIGFMGLIGIIVSQLINNFFVHNSGFGDLISMAAILIFCGLTAYDMQKIKQLGQSRFYQSNFAVLGALTLYLDFINLFIHLLRFFGNRRD